MIFAAAGIATAAPAEGAAGATADATAACAEAAGSAALTGATGKGLVCGLASVSILAMTSSLVTDSPSFLRICAITPASGAGTSSTTLSVSISIRISSCATGSPGFFFQVSRVASATDSESWGTLMSISAMMESGIFKVAARKEGNCGNYAASERCQKIFCGVSGRPVRAPPVINQRVST